MESKRWQMPPEAPASYHASLPDLNPLVRQVLFTRGKTSADAARDFLAGEPDHTNPFDLPQMSALVDRLRRAIRQQEEIAVYGDYDVDGITALVVLISTLTALGARVRPYIPHRINEEYGLNKQALYNLRQDGVGVVVTVDCGIRSVDEVEYGQSIGLDILITDHHSAPEVLPPAVAVVDPKLPGSRYPFCELAGVGVAYRTAQALLRVERRMAPRNGSPASFDETGLLDLVALGTVADVVPLRGENRTLVREGLAVLNSADRPGLLALTAIAGLHRGQVSSEEIAFGLAPRLNAAGRLDTALLAYELLSTQDVGRARDLATQMQGINTERQQLTEDLTERARQCWPDGPQDPLLLFAGEGMHKGIVGLVASRLTDEFYRPAVIIDVDGEHCRGSARSIPGFNITEALGECRDLLERYGGHAMAAGFALCAANLEPFRQRLMDVARERLADVPLHPTLAVDAVCPLTGATWDAQRGLEQLRPFGQEFPVPVLASRNVQVRDARIVGRNHLRLTVSDGRTVWTAIAFRQGRHLPGLPSRLDLAYNLGVNHWNGDSSLQLVVRDLRAAEPSM